MLLHINLLGVQQPGQDGVADGNRIQPHQIVPNLDAGGCKDLLLGILRIPCDPDSLDIEKHGHGQGKADADHKDQHQQNVHGHIAPPAPLPFGILFAFYAGFHNFLHMFLRSSDTFDFCSQTAEHMLRILIAPVQMGQLCKLCNSLRTQSGNQQGSAAPQIRCMHRGPG